MNEIELKTCPHCGGEAGIINLGAFVAVGCRTCKTTTTGYFADTVEEAVKQAAKDWNKRESEV